MSGLVAASDAYATSQGAEIDSESTSEYIENTFESASKDSYLYKFKYSREQELEADIIAIRFLEWIGINPQYYIDTLKQLGTEYDLMYDEESDHPTTKYRIDLLSFLIKNYPMTKLLLEGNKETEDNDKRKHRQAKEYKDFGAY